MKVLLVQPRVSAEPAYPLGLASMIPLLERDGAVVVAADMCFEDAGSIALRARREGVSWAGATVLRHNAGQVRPLFERLASECGARTFVAGALATLDPGAALESTGADLAIVGDPELAVARLVSGGPEAPDAVSIGDVRSGRVPVPARVPLDDLPLPDRRRFPIDRYAHAMRSMATPYAAAFTSRGCLRSCPYCASPSLRPGGFDARSPEGVVEEFRLLALAHGVRSIHLEDDAFLADPGRVEEICRRLIVLGLPVIWEAVNGVRPDEADGPLLDLMARAGCRRVVFSFEHIVREGAPEVGCSLEEALRAARLARGAGMRVGGYFIVGLPGTTRMDAARSIRMALDLDLDDTNFTPLYDLHGSAYDMTRPVQNGAIHRRPVPAAMASAAQIAFFTRWRPLGRMALDIVRDPRTMAALGRKAAEALLRGPVPARDNP